MRILFAIKSLARQSGGSERVLVHLANALARRGHEMSVLTWDAPDAHPFYRLNSNVNLINRGIGESGRQTRPVEFARRLFDLRRRVVYARPDIAVGFGHSMFVPLAFALVATGVTLIASEHAARVHYRKRAWQYALLRAAVRCASCMTVTTAAIGADYSRDVRRRTIVMPNPIMIEDVRRAPRSSSLILNVGRLDPQKDQATLIDAFSQVAPRFPRWRLRILGEGRLRPALEAQIRRLDLQERVDLPGITDAIIDAYASADIFALSSSYESFGLAALEAMSQELPVLCFEDCPGVDELIDQGRGGLRVAPGQDRASAFAQGLERLMANESLRHRLGTAGRARAEALAAQDDAIERWERLLTSTPTEREAMLCAG